MARRKQALTGIRWISSVVPLILLAAGAGSATASVVPREHSTSSDVVGSSPTFPRGNRASTELFKRQFGPNYCKMPDGRQICGPECGACPESHCCRGTDMTCGAGPAFCATRCTPQFSIGTCSAVDNNRTRNHIYDWWDVDGPGGSRNGRIQPPSGFPTQRALGDARSKAIDGGAFAAKENLKENLNPTTEVEQPDYDSEASDENSIHASISAERGVDLEPNAAGLPLNAVCNATAARPSGGCQSSCCINGRCTFCDKCFKNANVSSYGCKWCMKLNKPISPEGCLFRGDVCTVPAGMAAANPISGCKTGCCKKGRCTWCEDCYLGCKCRALGQPLNPNGRCVTRTRTTSQSKTKTRTTTTVRGSGPGNGMDVSSCIAPGMVALTFDDGPWIYTETLLNKLRDRGVKATFFVNGQNAGNIFDRANLIRRMKAEGHCVGSHGWTHANEAELGFDLALQNMRPISDAIESIIGLRPKFHRPPYGDYNYETQRAAAVIGQNIAYWNLDPNDWNDKIDPVSQIRGAIAGKSPNTEAFMVLLHDIKQRTVEQVVDQAIDAFRAQGFTNFVDMGTCRSGTIAGCYQ